ncbi:TMEM175 family protein [Methanosphaera sp.]
MDKEDNCSDEMEMFRKFMELYALKKKIDKRINDLEDNSNENHDLFNEFKNFYLNENINTDIPDSVKKFRELFNEENNTIDAKPIINTINSVAIPENTSVQEHVDNFNNLSDEDKQEVIKIVDNHRKTSFYKRMIDYLKVRFNSFNKDVDIDPSRLLALTDGIFGMVITLLAFGISIPDVSLTTYSEFIQFMISITPDIGVVFVSFIVVSSFWIFHHEYIKINDMNVLFLWLNLIHLAFISFIPFTTSIIGNYSSFFLANVAFGLNVFVTIVTFLLLLYYGCRHDFLDEKVSSNIRYITHTFMILMGLTVIVNLLDFLVAPGFMYLFLLLPVVSTIREIA